MGNEKHDEDPPLASCLKPKGTCRITLHNVFCRVPITGQRSSLYGTSHCNQIRVWFLLLDLVCAVDSVVSIVAKRVLIPFTGFIMCSGFSGFN